MKKKRPPICAANKPEEAIVANGGSAQIGQEEFEALDWLWIHDHFLKECEKENTFDSIQRAMDYLRKLVQTRD